MYNCYVQCSLNQFKSSLEFKSRLPIIWLSLYKTCQATIFKANSRFKCRFHVYIFPISWSANSGRFLVVFKTQICLKIQESNLLPSLDLNAVISRMHVIGVECSEQKVRRKLIRGIEGLPKKSNFKKSLYLCNLLG